ncbi:hypothetical protein FB45DRAFT_889279 [Roridomyces roridus]|uniref:Uncharacterized protein n=1 Tax=Roridomyces roridus TaxID=1738132 RepID=A0AAD7CK96_9AGAR|nr:hypothetical protein FB45DRAFT_889279 [Roridomyces roridus]
MLDHYYTPRDLVANADLTPLPDTPIDLDVAKPPRSAPAVVDLTALDLLAFDCDSDSDSGSDDGYVSTLLRMKAQAQVATPRRIAGARRVARAASAPGPARMMEVDLPGTGNSLKVPSPSTSLATGTGGRTVREGEMFQSITAIPGLESTSFEELRLETYLQSLIATGTARPPPASAPALVIPPAFQAQFCESRDEDEEEEDVEMEDATDASPAHKFTFASPARPPIQPVPHHRPASFPFTHWAA